MGKNGELLALAASNGFDALTTIDAGIEFQQNLAALPCSVVAIASEIPAREIQFLHVLIFIIVPFLVVLILFSRKRASETNRVYMVKKGVFPL